jgi:hypothetical protein
MPKKDIHDPGEDLRLYREIIAQEIERMTIVAFSADQQRVINYVQQAIANAVRRLYDRR